jgi:hypothetical protein
MQADGAHFYSNNISLKIEFLRKNGTFDEDFRSCLCEDSELGCRLIKRGLRLLYNQNAVGYHHKYMSFADARRRAQLVAAAERVLQTKEGGVYFAEIGARRERSLKSRMRRFLTRWLTPALAPLKPLLDTQFPLPWIVYRAMYQRYCVPKARPAVAVDRNSEKGQVTVR